MEGLTEDERKALRGSKFAPLPSAAPTVSRSQPRLAHPGGPLKTNKAAALAKFLERKMQEPTGLSSINPKFLERKMQEPTGPLIVRIHCNASNSNRRIQHVNSFGDSEDMVNDDDGTELKPIKQKKKKNKNKKNKKQKVN